MFYGMNAWFLAALGLGWLLYQSVVAAPGWARQDVHSAAASFTFAHRRAAFALSAALALSAVLSFVAAFDDDDWRWWLGTAALIAAEAFHLAAMQAPAARIMSGDHAESAAADLAEWAKRAWVRLGFVALGVFFFILASH